MKEHEEVYQWERNQDELWVDFQIKYTDGYVKNLHHIYNEQGFLLEEREKGDFRNWKRVTEYDCNEDYCWRKKSMETIGSGARKTIIDTEYLWDGKTEEYKTVQEKTGEKESKITRGYTVYNDYGESIKEYSKSAHGYRLTELEYDCSEGWCKLLSRESKGVTKKKFSFDFNNIDEFERNLRFWWEKEDVVSESKFSFTWIDNKQEWKTSDGNGYRIYNDHGYVIEYFFEAKRRTYHTINTYDCEEL